MTPELNRVYVGDSTKIMRKFPPMAAVIVTDPVWPNASVEMHGSNDPYEALRRSAQEWPRLARTAIVHLGCDSDPRILSAIPPPLTFLRVAWLRYARPHYKGNILYSGDVAYVFGEARPPKGRHLLPGENTMTESRYERNGHPCPRRIEHLIFLIANFSKDDDVIIDPFFGSGTTGVAAERCGRKWIGIEINPEYAAIAKGRIVRERSQLKLAI